ncbi:MAG TPA: metallophosphoesterase [Anaerolineales bacterium]|nr:metallophosphoesterase [Anaerolineales bacterium]
MRWPIRNEARRAQVVPVTIPIRDLHPSLDGFKIVQMTDFHLYPYTQPELIQQAVELCNERHPDLAVLTGDYVWLRAEAIDELAQILSGIQAKHGMFAVVGNHDIWAGVETILSGLRRHGIPVLINEGVLIAEGGGSLYLAGLDDGQSGNADLGKALQNAPDGVPVILLLHEPDLADQTSLDRRIILQLSGHTHGGQVRVARLGPMILPYLGRKYDLGLYRINEMWLYTSGGIGTISVPFRYHCPPEVSEITLRRE